MKKKLNEFLNSLNEYIGLIDKGTIDFIRLNQSLKMLDSKEAANQLAFRLLKFAPKSEIKKVKELRSITSSTYAQAFFDALGERRLKLTKA